MVLGIAFVTLLDVFIVIVVVLQMALWWWCWELLCGSVGSGHCGSVGVVFVVVLVWSLW